jgi:hypothetical protein
MIPTFFYAVGAAALLRLPVITPGATPGSWPHAPGLSLRPPSSALPPLRHAQPAPGVSIGLTTLS